MARNQQYERSKAVKKLILDTALKIASEDGFENLTVRKISESIGYSTGVIYYHFQNKQEIINALNESRDRDAYNHVKTLIREDDSLCENTKRVMRYIAELSFEKKEAYYQLFASRRRPGEKYANEIWLRLSRDVVDIAVRHNEIQKQELEEKAKCLLSFFLGFDMLFLEFCPSDKKSTLSIADKIVDIITSGIS